MAELFTVVTSEDVDSESEIVTASITLVSITRSHHHTVHTGAIAFIPHDIVGCPKLIALAAYMKMTTAQQAV